MKKVILIIVFIGIGFLLGAGSTITIYYLEHQNTLVFTTTDSISAGEGILSPKGTDLIYDEGMKEGFDCLKLYINVDPKTLNERFEKRIEEKAFLVIPYWIK